MILRRFTQHIKEQNWFAVGLDVIVVIVGIFLGMQVQQWYEERERRNLSEVVSNRLVDDLLYEAFNYQYLVEYYDDVNANVTRVVKDLEGKNGLPDEEFLIAAYRATQYLIYFRRSTTYDEITANGQFDLINDPVAKVAAEYVYNFDLIDTIGRLGRTSDYRTHFRKLVPIWIQEELLKKCGDKFVEDYDYDGIVNSLDYPCKLDIEKDEIEKYVNLLREDTELLGLLRLQYSNIQTAVANLTFYFPAVRDNLKTIVDKYSE